MSKRGASLLWNESADSMTKHSRVPVVFRLPTVPELPFELQEPILQHLSTRDHVSLALTSRSHYHMLRRHRLPKANVFQLMLNVEAVECKADNAAAAEGESPEALSKRCLVLHAETGKSVRNLIADEVEKRRPLELNLLREKLSEINLKEKLLFEYFDVPEALIAEFFRKKIVSKVRFLSFAHCNLEEVSLSYFQHFLRSSACEELIIEFCRLNQDLLCDELFASIPLLKNLQLHTRGSSVDATQLTDKTLSCWAKRIAEGSRFDIRIARIITSFTLPAILELARAAANSQSSYWHLGILKATELLNVDCICFSESVRTYKVSRDVISTSRYSEEYCLDLKLYVGALTIHVFILRYL